MSDWFEFVKFIISTASTLFCSFDLSRFGLAWLGLEANQKHNTSEAESQTHRLVRALVCSTMQDMRRYPPPAAHTVFHFHLHTHTHCSQITSVCAHDDYAMVQSARPLSGQQCAEWATASERVCRRIE